MRLKKIFGIAAIVLVMALTVIKLIKNKQEAVQKIYQYDKLSPIRVATDTIKVQDIQDETSYTGIFEPDMESKVSPDIQGRIKEVLVDVGSNVRKDQALVQLDNSLLHLQLEAVQLQIEGLQKDLDRYTALVKADAVQGVQLEKTELGLKAARVQQATIEEQIRKTTIRAPFDGVVTLKLNEAGGYAAPGVPIVQLTNLSKLKFTIQIPEARLSKFETDQSYSIIADALPDVKLSGKVVLVGSKANMGNSFPVQFSIQNTTDMKIKSGMFGHVELANRKPLQGIIIPTSAIMASGTDTKVYLLEKDKAVLKSISIGESFKNQSVVKQGLKENDILITSGFINLFENANVVVN